VAISSFEGYAEALITICAGATGPSNKELKLTKPSQNEASQLNSVFAALSDGAAFC
jgi:hypothetical protein